MGFSSGLSPAPQAVPQAAAFFHPNKFASAIFLYLRLYIWNVTCSLAIIVRGKRQGKKYAQFYYLVTFL